MADKQKIVWFVEPNDTFTSQKVGEAIYDKTKRVDEMRNIPCAKKPTWEMPEILGYDFIRFLWESKRNGIYPFGLLDFNTHYLTGGVYKQYRLQDTDVRKSSRKRMIKKAA